MMLPRTQSLLDRINGHLGCLPEHILQRHTAQLLSEARAEIDALQRSVDAHCMEWAEEHTHAQMAAKKVGIPEIAVEGNSYAVPGITELIDMIAAKIK